MYARPEVKGEVLDFGVSGKLIMNALVMYDRQTESYWSQMLGHAVEGPLEGAELVPVPYAQMSWGEWRQLHPESKALQTVGWDGRDPYAGYFERPDAGVIGEANPDRRLPTKAMVTAAVVEGVPVAYPWEVLETGRVVNDVVGAVPVLAIHAPEVSSTVLFDRRVGGTAYTFRSDPDPPEGASGRGRYVVDEETGSLWMAWTGVAVEGPLAGSSLDQIPAMSVFWFAWSDFHPETELYGFGDS